MHDPFAEFMLYCQLVGAIVAAGGFMTLYLSAGRIARLVAAVVLAIGLALVSTAFAAPPAGGPGPFSDWYKSLQIPGGGSCCDESDCRAVAGVRSVRILDEDGAFLRYGYEVLVTPETHGAAAPRWVTVPPDRVLARENPTGRPVACWLPERGVMCFVRATEI